MRKTTTSAAEWGKPATACLGMVAFLLAACSPVDSGNEEGSDESSEEPNASEIEDNFGTPVDASQAQKGGDLVFGLTADGDALDPTTSTALVNQHVFASMCQALYRFTGDGSIEPLIATDLPELSDDGTVYTITVREDAVFSDGTPMTAEDVVATFERNLEDPESQRRSELGPMESVEATGDHEVTVTLSEPFSPLLSVLADRPGMIQNPASIEEGFSSDPSCVAPFRFVDRVANTSITLEKDPNYFDADSVYLDSIEFRIMPDANVLATNLESGDVHAANQISPQDIGALVESEHVEVLSTENAGYQGLHINLDESTSDNSDLATNETVRRALSMAIDRDGLADASSNGVWDGACGPIAPTSPFSTDLAQECPEYDPDAARELLEEAGVEVPFTVELTVPNQQDPQRYAQALQSSVEAGGFNIEVQITEFATVLSDLPNGNFDAALLGWGGRPDPDGNMQMYWLSDGSTNYSSYENEEFDDLMATARYTVDEEERAGLYGEATRILHEDLPYIFTYRIRNIAGANGVEGVSMNVVGIIDPSFAAFTE